MKGIAFLSGLINGLVTLGVILPAYSQVTSDGTTDTTVKLNGNNFDIINGIQKGNNLFHSFDKFSIPTGSEAVFKNTNDVVNIINRVTGGNISNIDGLIKSQGNANLFLINPAGIVFGENARLDIGGSFFGSTAESILFKGGFNYSAISQEAPLLTVSVPLGLQMGKNPGVINNQGAILEVKSGNTLALIGGDISQTGGELRVAGGGGSIELASLDDSNQIKFKQDGGKWIFDSSNIETFRDIRLTQTLIDGSGEGSASVNAIARDFLLSDNSRLIGNNQDSSQGGNITINADSSILIQQNSDLVTQTFSDGNAGDIAVYAPKITLKNNGDIVTVNVSGSGNTGAISMEAQEIVLSKSPDFTDSTTSGIVSVTLDKGNGNDISMIADSITFNPGAVTNLTTGEGSSGTTTLKAKTIDVFNGGGNTSTRNAGNGGDLNFFADTFYMEGSSGFTASSFGKEGGKAGDINVTAQSIIIRDDSGLGNDTFGSGNAGNINFKADYIELDDAQIISRTAGVGDAGKINISSQILRILNGGQLNATTKSRGNGGNITVTANTVELNGEPTRGELANKNTGIISSVLPDIQNPNALTGDGGNIDLTTSSLVIRDGALVAASTSAGTGNGGDITVNLESLDVLNGGQVMNLTRSAGNAGTITINVGDRILVSGSDALHVRRQSAYVPGQDFSDVEYNIGAFSGIYANSTQVASGNGGNLQINGGTLRIEDKGKVSVSSLGTGSAGSFNAVVNTLSLDMRGSLEAESNGSNGNLSLDIDKALILRGNSKITTNATGTANGGNITINSPVIAGFENSDIIANAVEGNGGNIDVTTQGIFGLKFRDKLSEESDISASSESGVNGTVAINNIGIDPNSGLVELPIELKDSSQQIATGCSSNTGNTFVATGRGGIPQNPTQYLNSNRIWSDIRNFVSNQVNNQPSEITSFSEKKPIIEATGFIRNSKGEIELVAAKNKPLKTQALNCSRINR
jgi:filamentous hemagglutinin family protein